MSDGNEKVKVNQSTRHIGEEVQESQETFIKALGLGAFAVASCPSAVDVKNGKIVRIRPLHYDSKYTEEEIAPWEIKRNGKTFKPLLKSQPAPYMLVIRVTAASSVSNVTCVPGAFAVCRRNRHIPANARAADSGKM